MFTRYGLKICCFCFPLFFLFSFKMAPQRTISPFWFLTLFSLFSIISTFSHKKEREANVLTATAVSSHYARNLEEEKKKKVPSLFEEQRKRSEEREREEEEEREKEKEREKERRKIKIFSCTEIPPQMLQKYKREMIRISIENNGLKLGEFRWKKYSFGMEDGIVWALFQVIGVVHYYFVEIVRSLGTNGSNSKHLETNCNWKGLKMEYGPPPNFSPRQIAHSNFVTVENVCEKLREKMVPIEIDFVSIHIDGNDFYLLSRLLDHYHPRAVAVAYQNDLGPDAHLVNIYKPNFRWKGDCFKSGSFNAFLSLMEYHDYSIVHVESPFLYFVFDEELAKAPPSPNRVFFHINNRTALYQHQNNLPPPQVMAQKIRDCLAIYKKSGACDPLTTSKLDPKTYARGHVHSTSCEFDSTPNSCGNETRPSVGSQIAPLMHKKKRVLL